MILYFKDNKGELRIVETVRDVFLKNQKFVKRFIEDESGVEVKSCVLSVVRS